MTQCLQNFLSEGDFPNRARAEPEGVFFFLTPLLTITHATYMQIAF